MIDDDTAGVVIRRALDLAVAVRDGPAHRRRGCVDRLLDAAGGDVHVALSVTAALIQADRLIERWWQQDAPSCPRPGHWAVKRHQRAGQPLCAPCRIWAAGYEAARVARSRRGAA